jgi:hypothetical protein
MKPLLLLLLFIVILTSKDKGTKVGSFREQAREWLESKLDR